MAQCLAVLALAEDQHSVSRTHISWLTPAVTPAPADQMPFSVFHEHPHPWAFAHTPPLLRRLPKKPLHGLYNCFVITSPLQPDGRSHEGRDDLPVMFIHGSISSF